MNWSRAKTILIILFLVLDAFLLVTLLQTRAVSMKISDEVIQKTAQVLNEHNILIRPEQIPKERVINRNVIMNHYFEEPAYQAEQMLTSPYETVYADEGKHEYQFESNEAILHIKGTSFTYKTKKEIYKDVENQNRIYRDSSEKLAEMLQKMGFDKKSFTLENVNLIDGIYSCEVIPLYKGIKIYGVRMSMTATQNEVVSLSGNWFVATGTEEFADEKLLDITTVLLDLMYHPEFSSVQISKIESGYLALEEYLSSREMAVIPVYVIVDSLNTYYYVDACTGEMIS